MSPDAPVVVVPRTVQVKVYEVAAGPAASAGVLAARHSTRAHGSAFQRPGIARADRSWIRMRQSSIETWTVALRLSAPSPWHAGSLMNSYSSPAAIVARSPSAWVVPTLL